MPAHILSFPFIARIGHGLSATGLARGVSHLATQFLKQFQSRNRYFGIKLIHIAGDEKAYFFVRGHGFGILIDIGLILMDVGYYDYPQ